MAVLTNKSDVIANFVRYHGRQPNASELAKGGLIEYLTSKSPQEVESLLAKNSPITGGKLWADYQNTKTSAPIISPPAPTPTPAYSPVTAPTPTPTPTPAPVPAPATTQQATLSSPDGKYKVVVTVGSAQASQLQSKGWKIGETGKTVTNINTALSYNITPTLTPTPVATPVSTVQQATLTSADGNYKVVVNVGSHEASALQGAGWKLGNTGKNLVNFNDLNTTTFLPTTPKQETPTPQVVNITADEITKAFKAYGFTPTDADLQYWALKPNTDLTNLHEKLQARKDNDAKTQNDKAKAQNEQAAAGANGELVWEDQTKGGLIKFATDPDGAGPLNTTTIFWVNPTTKKIIPIVSAEAYETFFDTPFASANIKTITADYLGADGALGANAGYTMVPLSQGINGTESDDVYKTGADKVNIDNVGKIYGQTPLSIDQSIKLLQITDGFLDLISKDSTTGISVDLINRIKIIPIKVAFYMNALAYGGYNIGNVYQDLKRKQLVKDGNTDLANTVVISDTQKASDYYNTAAGSAAKNNPLIAPPQYLGNVDMSLLNYPIFNLPQEAFDVLVPPFDPTSEEGKAEMDKIQTAFYDVTQQQLNANTAKEKAIADTAYKQLQQDTKEKFGIALSDNATTAWNQLQSLTSSASNAGISGSGMEQEAIDKQLQATRKTDMQNRKSEQTVEDQAKGAQLQKYGSAEEIAALTDEEKVKYGFKPSADALAYFSVANLKSLYPDLDDETLQNYANSIIDPTTGTYRSDLYQTLYNNTQKNAIAKKTYQIGDVSYDANGNIVGGYGAMYNEAKEAEKAYAPFTQQTLGSKPFDTSTSTQAGASSSGITPIKETTVSTAPTQTEWNAAGNVGVAPFSTTTTTPPVVTPIPAATADKKITVTDKNGNKILVYESSIPALKAEGTIL
jgi:hypothetical protein